MGIRPVRTLAPPTWGGAGVVQLAADADGFGAAEPYAVAKPLGGSRWSAVLAYLLPDSWIIV
jgi:hypothetical protein